MLSQEAPRVLMQLGQLLKANIARFASASAGNRPDDGRPGERARVASLSSNDRIRLGSLGRRPKKVSGEARRSRAIRPARLS